jgi:hypothetical protein
MHAPTPAPFPQKGFGGQFPTENAQFAEKEYSSNIEIYKSANT